MKQTVIAVTISLLTAAARPGIAQTVYQLPFASSNNSIELTVANTSSTVLSGVRIAATDLPSWLRFSNAEQRLDLLKPGASAVVRFSFSVDKSAPVNVIQKLDFAIFAASNQWSKQITVTVAPPEKFQVFQNFPNPFNPTTAISYQLSAVSRVNLKIYNLLGQEVASLVDGDRLPGYHQETWDATRYSSGMYIYQLIATDERGQKQIARKRMMLLK